MNIKNSKLQNKILCNLSRPRRISSSALNFATLALTDSA